MDPSYSREAAEQREMDETKKGAAQSVRPVSSPGSEEDIESSADPAWAPGFWVRFPWAGFGALSIVLLTSMGSIITLMLSDGKSETHWVKQLPPNVILNQMNNIANICFGLAIGNGIAIAWWRKTLQGATIKQLHRSWAFSSSIKDVALAGRYFNFIALAALTTKLTIIDSSLMQKAFSTYVGTDLPFNTTISGGLANETIPITGVVATRSQVPSTLSLALSEELQYWSTNGGMYMSNFAGCDGLCFLEVPAAGFEIDCSEPVSTAVDFGNSTANALVLQNSGQNLTASEQAYVDANYNANMFGVSFAVKFNDPVSGNVEADGTDYSYLTLDVISSSAVDSVPEEQPDGSTVQNGICPGTNTKQTCRLRPAVINYPIAITNYPGAHAHNGLQLGTRDTPDPKNASSVLVTTAFDYNRATKQQDGFEVLRYNDVHEYHDTTLDPNTRVGGLQLAFNTYLGGGGSFSYSGPAGYYLEMNGSVFKYMVNSKPLDVLQCGFDFVPASDITNDVVTAVNQIMLLNALKGQFDYDPNGWDFATQGQPPVKNYTAVMFIDSPHYKTNIYYMIGAVVSTFICVLCVLPTYWGFWQLGRKVALSPFEIAAAFRSPMVNTSGDINDIIKKKGDQSVQYGHIVTGDAAGRLGIAEPEYVERAHGSAKKDISEKFGGVFNKGATN